MIVYLSQVCPGYSWQVFLQLLPVLQLGGPGWWRWRRGCPSLLVDLPDLHVAAILGCVTAANCNCVTPGTPWHGASID